MAEPLIVVGAGGFGRETIDVVMAINAEGLHPVWDLAGVVDDDPSAQNLTRLEALGVSYLGPVERLARTPEVAVSIAVGSPKARARICCQIEKWRLTAPDLRHPTAVFGSQFRGGGGLVACAHVTVGTNVTLGRHVHLNSHAAIGHDTEVGDFVSVNPAASISGDCTIEEGVLIGAGGVVLNALTVGAHATVGGSACVVREVPPGATVKGVPAK